MATLSIEARRSLAAQIANAQPPTLDAQASSLGTPIKVHRETLQSWHFVIPEVLPAPGEPLPAPTNDRELLDNAVLELFIENPALAEQAIRQPAVLGTALFGRLPDDFFFYVGPHDEVTIHREGPDELAVVLPLATRVFRIGEDDELSDAMLDLADGGAGGQLNLDPFAIFHADGGGRYPCNTDDKRFATDNAARPADGGGNG